MASSKYNWNDVLWSDMNNSSWTQFISSLIVTFLIMMVYRKLVDNRRINFAERLYLRNKYTPLQFESDLISGISLPYQYFEQLSAFHLNSMRKSSIPIPSLNCPALQCPFMVVKNTFQIKAVGDEPDQSYHVQFQCQSIQDCEIEYVIHSDITLKEIEQILIKQQNINSNGNNLDIQKSSDNRQEQVELQQTKSQSSRKFQLKQGVNDISIPLQQQRIENNSSVTSLIELKIVKDTRFQIVFIAQGQLRQDADPEERRRSASINDVQFNLQHEQMLIQDNETEQWLLLEDIFISSSQSMKSLQSLDNKGTAINLPQCVVCLSDYARIITLPCRHNCMCFDCFKLPQQQVAQRADDGHLEVQQQQARVTQCVACRAEILGWVEIQDSPAVSQIPPPNGLVASTARSADTQSQQAQ
ncbi:hypothetical protein MIR68_001564 [Amoeboaphelidium protococcarum]|nr:hypothetical protein MIR68_001564 [Amoeboaphelidium protococcarum]